jgi:hypothetical protein
LYLEALGLSPWPWLPGLGPRGLGYRGRLWLGGAKWLGRSETKREGGRQGPSTPSSRSAALLLRASLPRWRGEGDLETWRLWGSWTCRELESPAQPASCSPTLTASRFHLIHRLFWSRAAGVWARLVRARGWARQALLHQTLSLCVFLVLIIEHYKAPVTYITLACYRNRCNLGTSWACVPGIVELEPLGLACGAATMSILGSGHAVRNWTILFSFSFFLETNWTSSIVRKNRIERFRQDAGAGAIALGAKAPALAASCFHSHHLQPCEQPCEQPRELRFRIASRRHRSWCVSSRARSFVLFFASLGTSWAASWATSWYSNCFHLLIEFSILEPCGKLYSAPTGICWSTCQDQACSIGRTHSN